MSAPPSPAPSSLAPASPAPLSPARDATSEAPELPQEPVLPPIWYFYCSRYSIDEELIPFSAESFRYGSPKPGAAPDTPPVCSQSTMRRFIYPVADWLPFSPADNARLATAKPEDPAVAVGHERLLFEVCHLELLKPIYWPLPQYAPVIGTHWVFQETLTPIEPSWDAAIVPIYERFVKNYVRVRETYERATENASALQECVHLLDLRQEQKYLRVAVLFSACSSEVYIFKAGSSYIQTRTTAGCLLKGKTPRDVLAVLDRFDFAQYKRKNALPDRASDDPSYLPLPVNNVVLVLHGVGQKLSDSYSRVNFVYAIDRLRVQIVGLTRSQEVQRHFPDGESEDARFLILPVNWRSAFKSTERPFDTESILVRSLQHLRHSFVDALMDIPLYMSENRRPGMLAAAASEANRLFDLVCAHHPGFAETGRVHLIGHSLGSLITADLLSQQPSSLETPEDLERAPFKFAVHNFFNTGSMLGMFMMLKEKRLVPRAEWDAQHPPTEERPFGCFAARNVYNVIHPCDLLCFLMDATVEGADTADGKRIVGPNGDNFEPCELPYMSSTSAKVGVTTPAPAPAQPPSTPPQPSPSTFSKWFSLVSPRAKPDEETSEEVREIREELIDEFKRPPRPRRYSRVQAELFETLPPGVRAVRERFLQLNENGQIDWRIPDHTRYTASHYLKILTAHFDYWSNREAAKFVAVECLRRVGTTHTLPEYRCQWTVADEPARSVEPEVQPID